MIREGDMVRAGGGPVMKVIYLFQGMARCIWIDGRGRIQQRFAYLRDLNPLSLSVGPRSLWPDVIDLPDEKRARAIVPATARRPKSTKPRRSNKIKRKPTMRIAVEQ